MITIESFSFDISAYVQQKADTVDALTDLDVKVDDNDMSDRIPERIYDWQILSSSNRAKTTPTIID